MAEEFGVNKERGRENLYEVRRLTGFTWNVLADLFMVDRRTLYNWTQGGAIAESSKLHLAGVLDVLRFADRGMAEKNSVALYEPGKLGDPFWLLKRQRFDDAKLMLGAGPGRASLPALPPNDRTRPLGIGFFDDDGPLNPTLPGGKDG